MTIENREVKHITQKFEDHLVKLHDEYIALHDKFNIYRGVLITPENHKEIEQILIDLQNKFNEMWPMMHYIKNRYETTLHVEDNYVKFIKGLRGAGILTDEVAAEAKESAQA